MMRREANTSFALIAAALYEAHEIGTLRDQFSGVTFQFQFENFVSDEIPKRRAALAVTGGIAAYKSIEILRGLQRAGCDVRVAMTRHACEFIRPLTFRALSGSYVVVDDYAADNPDPIAHITFSQTIDILIIAPATANTLAKMANGVADDFVTSTYLACTAPVLVAPAMNTAMWHHPATQRNIQKLREHGVEIIEPDEGEMACGTVGPGRLSHPDAIVRRALEILEQRVQVSFTNSAGSAADLANEEILITTGATREPIDPVRFISNRSSGRMGFALAEAAAQRGAHVTVIAGFTTAPAPAAIQVKRVTSAQEMCAAVLRHIESAAVFIAAAAVADYRPTQVATSKIKKTESELNLKLERTPDILAEVARLRRPDQLVIGFAAETDDLLAHAQAKLKTKNLDMIVANDVSRSETGFDSADNAVTILVSGGAAPIELPLMPKLQVADKILDEIVKLRHRATAAKTA